MCEVESLPAIGIFSVSVSSVIVSSSSMSTHLHMACGIYKTISQMFAAKNNDHRNVEAVMYDFTYITKY